jgi:putative ABC transport system permease protein
MIMTGGIQRELERNRRLMGADLALVPPGTKETGHTDMAEGPPARGVVPEEAGAQLGSFPEIENSTRQTHLGGALVGNVQALLIAFEPATDFAVLPWLEEKSAREYRKSPEGIVVGARVAREKLPGDVLELGGKQYPLAGRLRETGTFLDTAIFFPAPGGSIAEPSWILLRLRKGAYLDFMVNRLETNIARIEVIARPEILKTINDQLSGLLRGGGFGIATALVVVGVLLVTGVMFALMAQERRREFGLLKAMGARNAFVFRLVIGEAALLAGIGSFVGMALLLIWLLVSGVGPVHEEGTALSTVGFVLGRVLLTAGLTIAVGVLAALYPAIRAGAMEPYAAIRTGE